MGTGAKAVLALSHRKPICGWDVFLSHDWGVHDKSETHQRSIGKSVHMHMVRRRITLVVTTDSMTKGIDRSTCAGVYPKLSLEKVDGSSKNILNDNCRRENSIMHNEERLATIVC